MKPVRYLCRVHTTVTFFKEGAVIQQYHPIKLQHFVGWGVRGEEKTAYFHASLTVPKITIYTHFRSYCAH